MFVTLFVSNKRREKTTDELMFIKQGEAEKGLHKTLQFRSPHYSQLAARCSNLSFDDSVKRRNYLQKLPRPQKVDEPD